MHVGSDGVPFARAQSKARHQGGMTRQFNTAGTTRPAAHRLCALQGAAVLAAGRFKHLSHSHETRAHGGGGGGGGAATTSETTFVPWFAERAKVGRCLVRTRFVV